MIKIYEVIEGVTNILLVTKTSTANLRNHVQISGIVLSKGVIHKDKDKALMKVPRLMFVIPDDLGPNDLKLIKNASGEFVLSDITKEYAGNVFKPIN